MAGSAGEKDEYAIARGPSGRDLAGGLHIERARDLGEIVARQGSTGHSEELPPAEAGAIPKGIVCARLSAASESIFVDMFLTPLCFPRDPSIVVKKVDLVEQNPHQVLGSLNSIGFQRGRSGREFLGSRKPAQR